MEESEVVARYDGKWVGDAAMPSVRRHWVII